uniref:NADH dehydrogenase subunit 2 n=1 Tax=Forcipomyia pulchrithorax TaxID=3042879 RepID=UPI002A8414E8|nr:NADH dehydrogenase subunit 2 [Forcipomyia pulchrithorax]WOR86769.1 NADH dehydrogenase subunit 2 [Forcipomyia pulchrithorax]
MMNFIYKLIFLSSLMAGSIISISSSSWLGMWMGLEINLLSFIPLMIDNKNMLSSESAIKYFLTQAFASLIFLFVSILYIMKFNTLFNLNTLFYQNLIINSTMLLKMGAAPFHFWFPNVIEGLSWLNAFILLTWQKLAPLMILSYSLFSEMLYVFIIFSTLIGSIGGLNQTSLRKILAYSSINHIGWLLTALLFSNILWMFYFILYTIINFSIILIFAMLNLFNINQIFMFNNSMTILKSCLLMNFLSLGGLPPFMGFFPKWMVIENLIQSNNLFILFFIVMMALITLFFYIRLSFSGFTLAYPSVKSSNSLIINNKLMMINLLFNIFMIFTLLIIMMNNYYII